MSFAEEDLNPKNSKPDICLMNDSEHNSRSRERFRTFHYTAEGLEVIIKSKATLVKEVTRYINYLLTENNNPYISVEEHGSKYDNEIRLNLLVNIDEKITYLANMNQAIREHSNMILEDNFKPYFYNIKLSSAYVFADIVRLLSKAFPETKFYVKHTEIMNNETQIRRLF